MATSQYDIPTQKYPTQKYEQEPLTFSHSPQSPSCFPDYIQGPSPRTLLQTETYYEASAPEKASPSTSNPFHRKCKLQYNPPLLQVHTG